MANPSFKLPMEPPPKKIKRVLEEDTYLEQMGDIIERYFFPDLKMLRSCNEKANAEMESKVTSLTCDSPATFETPNLYNRSTENTSYGPGKTSGEEELNERVKIPPGMSLDQFVETFTTENNVNFQELINKSDAEHKKKFQWMYKDENEINDLSKRLEVPSIEEQSKGLEKTASVDTWTYKIKNALMFAPGVTNQKGRDTGGTIAHKNTNFKEVPFDVKKSQSQIQQSAENQARIRSGKIGIDGKIVLKGGTTPKIYNYIRTPSPAPGASETPLMTWGEIDGSPFHVEGSKTPAFHMPKVPKRDKLAHALADKVTENHRNEKRKAAEAARPIYVSPSPSRTALLGAMSPAARRLAANTLGCRISSKTPEPSAIWNTPRNTPLTLKAPTTPSLKSTKKIISGSITPRVYKGTDSHGDITDNLLSLSTSPYSRPRAEDFF